MHTTILNFCTCSRDAVDIFPHFEKKNHLNLAFSSDTIKARSFKLCMIIALLWVYIFIEGLMTLALFQGHRCVRNINSKLHVWDSCPVYLKHYMAATVCIQKIMHNMICVTMFSREVINMFFFSQMSELVKPSNIGI